MNDTAEVLLKGYSPGVQDLIQQARRLIMKLVPDAHEKVYLGWRTIGYSTTGGIPDGFCAIDPQKTRINFVFQRGIDLDDPAGLLEGTGKKMRHVKIETIQQLNSRALKALIKAAAQLKPED